MGNNMGNTCSYKWSSVEFSKESSLICTSHSNKSKFTIFRLSVNSERVLLRLADSLCDDHPVRSLYVEITAERDNNNGCFNFGVVRVVADGTCEQTVRDTESFTNLCRKKSCFYGVMRKSRSGILGSAEKKVTCWEVLHSYNVTLTTHVRYSVMIKCDEVTGLSAEVRGPFECEGQVSREGLLKQCSSAGSLIQRREVKGKPPKAFNAFVESEFTGTEYILFQREEKARRIKIVNTDGNFNGNGNGSEYRHCNIIMKYEAKGTH